MRQKPGLAAHSPAGPRSAKRPIRARSQLTSACHVVGRMARNSGGLCPFPFGQGTRSEEHTSELQSRLHLVCRLLLEKKKKNISRSQYWSIDSQLYINP